MGSIVNITCSDCKNNEEYFLGIGFMYFSENVFFKNLSENELPIIYDLVKSKNIINIVKKYLENGAIPGDEYGNDFYYCEKCKIIDSYFYFSLENNGEVYIPNYECNICKNKMKRIIDFNELKLEIKCKKCGKNNIMIQECGDWD